MEFEIENELITIVELGEFEQKLDGLELPLDYKQHMLKYNGGTTIESYTYNHKNESIDFYYFLPIKFGSDTMESSLVARENVLPKEDIYIGAILGGALCMSLGKNYGAIYAFYSDGERIDLASSFSEFVNGLTPLEE